MRWVTNFREGNKTGIVKMAKIWQTLFYIANRNNFPTGWSTATTTKFCFSKLCNGLVFFYRIWFPGPLGPYNFGPMCPRGMKIGPLVYNMKLQLTFIMVQVARSHQNQRNSRNMRRIVSLGSDFLGLWDPIFLALCVPEVWKLDHLCKMWNYN